MTNMVLTRSQNSHNMALKLRDLMIRTQFWYVVSPRCLEVNEDQTWPQHSTKHTLTWSQNTELQFVCLWLLLAIKKGRARHGSNMVQSWSFKDTQIKQFMTIFLRPSGHSLGSFRALSGPEIRVDHHGQYIAINGPDSQQYCKSHYWHVP